jgi:hypothetical protein
MSTSSTRHGKRVSNLLMASGKTLVKLDAHKNMGGSASVCDEHRPIICGSFCLTGLLVELTT